MRPILILFLGITGYAWSHDHVEVGIQPNSPTQLGLHGPSIQLALYVPTGEFFSGYAPNFPGGCFADELTFTTETQVLDPAGGSDPTIELLSITGPASGSFAFWERDAASPTWSRPVGWNQSFGDRPSFPVNLGGDGHIHGRIFTTDRPGDYRITFRSVDPRGLRQPSDPYSLVFRALRPPPLSIRMENGQARIEFISRPNLVYDLEICTDLAANQWTPLDPHTFMDGTGQLLSLPVPLESPRAFFRLIEYR